MGREKQNALTKRTDIQQKLLNIETEKMTNDPILDDIFSEIYFMIQIDAGIRELYEDKGIMDHEVKVLLSKWIPRKDWGCDGA